MTQAEPTMRADQPTSVECTCVHDCANDPATRCSLSGDWHVHPDDPQWPGIFGPCPIHPDAPGDASNPAAARNPNQHKDIDMTPTTTVQNPMSWVATELPQHELPKCIPATAWSPERGYHRNPEAQP